MEGGLTSTDRVVAFLRSHNGQRVSIVAFSLAAVSVLVALPGTYAAFAFGIPLLFFVPGFATVRLVFWKGTSLEAKFVLSLGVSVLVVILLGLFLVFTVGLYANTTRGSLVVFTLAAVALETFWRPAGKDEEKKPEQEQVGEEEPQKVDKAVAAMVATALIVSAISLGLIVTAEYPSRTYLAMTDENGNATIQSERALGSNMTFIIEMHNGEDGPRDFLLVAHERNFTIYGERWFNQTLAEGETVQVEIVFELHAAGVFRLDFDLYIREGGAEPEYYGSVWQWIEVS